MDEFTKVEIKGDIADLIETDTFSGQASKNFKSVLILGYPEAQPTGDNQIILATEDNTLIFDYDGKIYHNNNLIGESSVAIRLLTHYLRDAAAIEAKALSDVTKALIDQEDSDSDYDASSDSQS